MKCICKVAITALLIVFGMLHPVQAAAKDTLVYVMGAEVSSLDPPNQTDALSSTVVEHIYDLPLHQNPEGKRIPALFTRWEHSADGLTWTFYLRKGVKFHDGTPFNAEAVKFNWERCTSETKKVYRQSFFTPWAQRIKVIDDYTIQTSFDKPFPPILQFLAHNSMAIVSPSALKKHGDQINRNPVGTGPFRFVEWIPGDRLVLERNEEFWGPRPGYKRLVFKFVKESSSRVMMLETGEADLVLKIPPVEIDRLKNNPNVDVLVRPSNRVIGFFVNTTAPLVNDVRFRRAVAYAIDRDSIIKYIMKGIAKPVCSPIADGTYGAVTPTCYEYNPQKARELLKEVGYKGEKLSLWTPQGRYEQDRETAEAVQEHLRQVGINVDFRVMEFASMIKAASLGPDKAKHHLALIGLGTTTGDGDQALRGRFHLSGIPHQNHANYNNPEYNKLAEAQASEVKEEKRLELMRQCQEMLAQELPYIPLHAISQVIGIRKNLKGVWVLPVERTFVREAYFKD